MARTRNAASGPSDPLVEFWDDETCAAVLRQARNYLAKSGASEDQADQDGLGAGRGVADAAERPRHTPGPWWVERDPRPGMEWNLAVAAPGDKDVCFMTHDGTPLNELGEANAALIAAAPELLEVAYMVLATAKIETPPAMLEAARLAIRKAEGRS